MKILFVSHGRLGADSYPSPNVGASLQTWGLSKELAKRGHEVYIIRRSNFDDAQIYDHVHLLGTKFLSIEDKMPSYGFLFHVNNLISHIRFSIKSLKLISKISPDISCIIDYFSGIFPAYLDIPKIYIMHTPDTLDFLEPYAIRVKKINSIAFQIKKNIEIKIMQNVDRVVVLNSFIEKYLRRKGLSHVTKIPNGIDADNFLNNGDNDYILYAGRFDWNKNVCSLVNVFTQIHKLYPSYYLYLVGSGPEEKRIISLVREKGVCSKVKIVPWLPRNKVMELMSRCSIFVLPSFFEVCPVVVLEAMASAKPVIARANMGTVDIITHGENGYLYNNDGELRAYLEKLLSDDNLRKKIGYNARCIVEREYTFSKIADKYEELFYKLLTKYKNLT
jgi:glycosyltransferase involved in cell wall biosynthesis